MTKLLSRQHTRALLLTLALLCAGAALLLYPREAMAAAREGLQLCYNVIIPSLFPFFVLSSLVVELGLAACLGRALEGLMRPLFRVGGCCASALVLGLIGGYPIGARTAISLYEKGLCSRREAERLLAFCNNSGPAFMLGVVGAGVFASSRVGVLLALAHTAASVCVGLVFRFYGREPASHSRSGPVHIRTQQLSAVFSSVVKDSFSSTLNICAFVVLFTVIIRLLVLSGFLPWLAGLLAFFLSPLGLTRMWAERLLTGALELSSGVWTLAGEGSLPGRLSAAAFMLGWAGLSVHCQTLSFLGGSDLSPRTYLIGKVLHGLLSALLVGLLARLLPLEAPVSAYLAEQVEGILALDFHTALTLSTVCAWVVFLIFLLISALVLWKNIGKRRRNVL